MENLVWFDQDPAGNSFAGNLRCGETGEAE
jgi:hypothetical protein